MTDAWLHIGRVIAVNASRRQLRVIAAPGCECAFDGRDRLWLTSDADIPVQVRIVSARLAGKEVIVELTPGISRDMVAELKNADVALPAETSCRKAEARAGLHDLPGMRVVTAAGDFVGNIIETRDTPGGGVMRLRRASAAMATAPVTDAFIREIDLKTGTVVVNEPEYFLVVDADDRDGKPPRKATQD